MPRGLWTTTVGSFPKPPHLERARNRFARGEISEAELRQLEREATIEVIRSQEEIGLDILVDGELYRGDMTTYFAELMDGFEISGTATTGSRSPRGACAAPGPGPWTGGSSRRARRRSRSKECSPGPIP